MKEIHSCLFCELYDFPFNVQSSDGALKCSHPKLSLVQNSLMEEPLYQSPNQEVCSRLRLLLPLMVSLPTCCGPVFSASERSESLGVQQRTWRTQVLSQDGQTVWVLESRPLLCSERPAGAGRAGTRWDTLDGAQLVLLLSCTGFRTGCPPGRRERRAFLGASLGTLEERRGRPGPASGREDRQP